MHVNLHAYKMRLKDLISTIASVAKTVNVLLNTVDTIYVCLLVMPHSQVHMTISAIVSKTLIVFQETVWIMFVLLLVQEALKAQVTINKVALVLIMKNANLVYVLNIYVLLSVLLHKTKGLIMMDASVLKIQHVVLISVIQLPIFVPLFVV